MASFEYTRTVKPGDKFRDWLIEVLANRIQDKDCEVRIFKLSHASHRVCKYEFKGEKLSVVAKFFAIPTGRIKKYDSYSLMKKEYEDLKKARKIIDVPEPIATNKNFNCALVSKYVSGRPLFWYFKHRRQLKEKLETVANMLRKLHDNTQAYYDKEEEFSKFNDVLNHLRISRHLKGEYRHLIRKWQHSSLLDMKKGCMIHNDSTPVNYVFHRGRPFFLERCRSENFCSLNPEPVRINFPESILCTDLSKDFFYTDIRMSLT